MHLLLALILILVCAVAVARAFMRPSALGLFLGTLSLFSIGYYGLPMLLIERSPLRNLPEDELTAVSLMVLIYLICILIGIGLVGNRTASRHGLRFSRIDAYLERHWWPGSIIANGIVLVYSLTRNVTFYQASSVDQFIAERSNWEGLLGFSSGLAQAVAAIYLARALVGGDRYKLAFAVMGLLMQMALVVTAGQRLVLITPVLLFVAALVAQRSFRIAGGALAAGIGVMLLISPFAVALRAGTWNDSQEVIAQNFTYGENPVETMLQSIVDRADILQTMSTLKAYVDLNGHVGPMYYYSVAVIPIPRGLYTGKPAVLSADGDRASEASILVWRLIVGHGIGSLTAFGSIIAYREGGWLWLPFNGVLTGMVFAYGLLLFSRGGFVGQAFFCLAFFRWSVMKVPPSLMEVMVDVMTYLPVIAILFVINRLLEGRIPPSLRAEPGQGLPGQIGKT